MFKHVKLVVSSLVPVDYLPVVVGLVSLVDETLSSTVSILFFHAFGARVNESNHSTHRQLLFLPLLVVFLEQARKTRTDKVVEDFV